MRKQICHRTRKIPCIFLIVSLVISMLVAGVSAANIPNLTIPIDPNKEKPKPDIKIDNVTHLDPNANITFPIDPNKEKPKPIILVKLTSRFSANPVSGYAPLTVTFKDTSRGSYPSAWEKPRIWNFGDGYTSYEQNPVHTYKEPGIYRVTLTVYKHFNRSDSSRDIEVKSSPIVFITPKEPQPY